jgi:F-type H+-transporting ATPase subunit gamma
MPSLKALRGRIKSVKNTRQITKTMKMVAAAKVRRARAAVESARPYAAKLAAVLEGLAGNVDGAAPLLLTGRATPAGTPRTVRLLIVGSDRGLCGGLNSNIMKAATLWVKQQQTAGNTVQLVAVGRKIQVACKVLFPGLLVGRYTDLGRQVELSHAQTIATESLSTFAAEQTDEVHVLCAECVSMLVQKPSVRQLIPFSAPLTTAADDMKNLALYEPSEAEVLASLLPLNLNMQVYSALLESAASEQAARMTAMDNATRNAGEMIKKLSVQYNRSRQASITKELIEIISGAEAV